MNHEDYWLLADRVVFLTAAIALVVVVGCVFFNLLPQ